MNERKKNKFIFISLNFISILKKKNCISCLAHVAKSFNILKKEEHREERSLKFEYQ